VIAERLNIPRRIVTILEGESLVNDATALYYVKTRMASNRSICDVSRPQTKPGQVTWIE
jgi:hypothetical protein